MQSAWPHIKLLWQAYSLTTVTQGSKGQTVGGQWAAEGSILIISLNETGHH